MNSKMVQENINNFLLQVGTEHCVPLENKKKYFLSCDKLLKKFRDQQKVWKKSGHSLVNDIVSITNELCIANLILRDTKVTRLEYEPNPTHSNSQKTIDFKVLMKNGKIIYFDVKTIQPLIQNDWEKFKKHKNLFPENIEVILDKKCLGGEIWHNFYASRQAMLHYALEFEEKILSYNKNDKTYFVMFFCGDGFDWGVSHLENFADFYSTGKHNPDDAFSKMENKFINDKKITFLKNINFFAYLERPKTNIKETKYICPVRGPWIENRWVSSNQ